MNEPYNAQETYEYQLEKGLQQLRGAGLLKKPLEAVTLALYLGLTALTEKQSQECATMAAKLAHAASLSEDKVDLAKATALAKFHMTKWR